MTVSTAVVVAGRLSLARKSDRSNTATAAAALQLPTSNAVNVPTLSQLGIAVFAALLLLAGVYFIRS